MHYRRLVLAAFAAAALGIVPAAAQPAAPQPSIEDPWVREVIPGQEITAAFLTIENPGDRPRRLVEVSCDCAKTVEMHRMAQSEGRMKMEPVEQIEIPAHGQVTLQPGGLHLMLFGARTMRAGESVRLTLRFEEGGAVEVTAPVRALGGKAHAGR